jgi:hypothetical protein
MQTYQKYFTAFVKIISYSEEVICKCELREDNVKELKDHRENTKAYDHNVAVNL